MSHRQLRFPQQQAGVVLLVLLLFLVLGASTFLLSALNQHGAQTKEINQSANALFTAKEMIIGWALAHPSYPGLLPYPDSPLDGNYDGQSDCPTVTITNADLLGQLPWASQDNNCPQPRHGVAVFLITHTVCMIILVLRFFMRLVLIWSIKSMAINIPSSIQI